IIDGAIYNATDSIVSALEALADARSQVIVSAANDAISATATAVASNESAASSAALDAALFDARRDLTGKNNGIFFTPLFPDGNTLGQLAIETLRYSRNVQYMHPATSIFIKWWESLLSSTDQTLFGEKLDLELAQQPPEFWGDGVNDFEPHDTFDRIYQLLFKETSKGPPVEDEPEHALEQRPAPYTFVERDGKLDAVPLDNTATDEDVAADLHAETLRNLEELQDRLKATQAPDWLMRTLGRLAEALGEDLSAIKPGTLLSRLNALETAEISYNSDEGRREVSADVPAAISALAEDLRDLRTFFPALREAEARRIGFDVADSDLEAVSAGLKRVADAGEASDALTDAARVAAREFEAEADSQLEVIATSSNDGLVAQARISASRSLARGLQTSRNMVAATAAALQKIIDKIPTDTLEAIKDALETGGIHQLAAGERYALAALLVALAGPLGTLAAFSAPSRILHKRLVQMIDAELKRRADGDRGDDSNAA
ncbi:MAG: hypothetical protein AAFY73_08090, partial [Pseudomonadota bacterium]